MIRFLNSAILALALLAPAWAWAQLVTLSEGVHESAPIKQIGDVFGAGVSWDISQDLDPAVTTTVEVYLSSDNGVTWELGGSATRQGGVGKNPAGNIVTQAGFQAWSVQPTYNAQNKFLRYTARWQAPLIKTITRVKGGSVQTKIDNPTPIKSVAVQADVPDLHHSIAVVQSTHASGNNVSTITTPAITTTSANLIILDEYFYQKLQGSTTTDSKSNTWTNSIARYDSTNLGAQQYYNANITGGASHTFTFNLTTNNFPAIAVTEVSGHASSPFDQAATVADNSGTSHTTASTGTLAQANNLVMGFGGAGGSATPSVSAPWTQLEQQANDGLHEGLVTGYKIVSATTAQSFTWATSASVEASGHVSIWKDATPGGGGASCPKTLTLLGVGC